MLIKFLRNLLVYLVRNYNLKYFLIFLNLAIPTNDMELRDKTSNQGSE